MKRLVLLTLASLIVFGCQSTSTEKPVSETKNAEETFVPEETTTSELALLMRKMYEDNQQVKEQVLKGEIPENLLEEFKALHTAEATDPEEINETYHAFADLYLEKVEALQTADAASRESAYNQMINSCIDCHKVYCHGPIPKIKKLKIN